MKKLILLLIAVAFLVCTYTDFSCVKACLDKGYLYSVCVKQCSD